MRFDARRADVERDDLERLLVEHTEAWNSHDIDRLMGLFAFDCVFARFEGRPMVRAAFAAVLRKQRPPLADLGMGHSVGF